MLTLLAIWTRLHVLPEIAKSGAKLLKIIDITTNLRTLDVKNR